MRILYVTSGWPTATQPQAAQFLVQQVESLRKNGLDVEVFPFQGRRKAGNYLRAYCSLHEKLKENSYDVVHAQWGNSGFLVSFPKRAPLVVTFHGSDLQGFYTSRGHYHPLSYPLRLAMQWVAKAADEVILVSDHMRHFLYRKECHVVPVGINLETFKPIPQIEARRKLGLDLNRLLVLFASNPLRPEKRYVLASEAVKQVQREYPALELIAGGNIPFTEMPIYMNACDALLLTSAHEGSPTVIKEALACNLPVVSVDVGDVRERIAKVPGCVVCQDHTPEAIADGIRAILSNRKRINGRAFVSDLDENILAKRIIQIYEKAAGNDAQKPAY